MSTDISNYLDSINVGKMNLPWCKTNGIINNDTSTEPEDKDNSLPIVDDVIENVAGVIPKFETKLVTNGKFALTETPYFLGTYFINNEVRFKDNNGLTSRHEDINVDGKVADLENGLSGTVSVGYYYKVE